MDSSDEDSSDSDEENSSEDSSDEENSDSDSEDLIIRLKRLKYAVLLQFAPRNRSLNDSAFWLQNAVPPILSSTRLMLTNHMGTPLFTPQALKHFKENNPAPSKSSTLASSVRSTPSGLSQTNTQVLVQPKDLHRPTVELNSGATRPVPRLQTQGNSPGTATGPSQALMSDVGGNPLIVSQVTSSLGLTSASGQSSQAVPTITHQMPIDEIIEQLRSHGCNDVTSQLDITNASEYPVSTGGFGDVYRGALRNGDSISLKCLRLRMDSTEIAKKQLKRAARELYVWSKCNHPNVLGLIGVAQYRNQLAMVSPWMENGNLRSFLSRQPQVDRYTLCARITAGVAYLHDQGVVHGDIKGDNILFSQDSTPKLADFGNAALREYTLQFTNTTSRAGTSLNWVAPELLEEETELTREADVYSLGMTIFEVITGSIPYAGMREPLVVKNIVTGKLPKRPEEHIPSTNRQADLLWSLLKSCWAYDPQDRPTAMQVGDKIRDVISEGLSDTPAP